MKVEPVTQLRTRIGLVTAKTDQLKGWTKGEQRDCFVSKMSNGRLAIYKGTRHFREESGYKTYDSIQDLEKDFITELIQEAITY